MALAVPLSRFTPRVGGGSAFFVRRLMKLLSIIICAFLLVGCASPQRTARNKCREIKPGMTRTELAKAGFIEDGSGHEMLAPHRLFKQHESFCCGGLYLVDVDFAPSDSNFNQPTDIIIKISEPYFDKTYGVRE